MKKLFAIWMIGLVSLGTLFAREPDYLCFTSTGVSSFALTQSGTYVPPTVEYRLGVTGMWNTLPLNTTIPMADGEQVFFRAGAGGVNDYFSLAFPNQFMRFTMTGSIAASGNLMSLVDATCQSVTIPSPDCFYNLFHGCASLTHAPDLPATGLTEGCYRQMFIFCTGLTSAPRLPATEMQPHCYRSMFYGCTNLSAAPRLRATTLADSCYAGLFHYCANLREVRVNLTDWSLSNSSNWLADVAPQGRFVCPTSLPRQYDVSHIPEGWVVEPDYLTFTAEEPSSFMLRQEGNFPLPLLEYRRNMDSVWTNLALYDTIPMARGDRVCFRAGGDGHNDHISWHWDGQYLNFVMTGSIAASGNIMSLVDATCESLTIPQAHQCFHTLFQNCTALTTPPDLPATTLGNDCYLRLFLNCSRLTYAPDLPATTVMTDCYQSMFNGCTMLTTPPALPATTLANSCYRGMFQNCVNLTTPPDLPATTLKSDCYRSMFQGCTHLEYAPELPAAALALRCYEDMFYRCFLIDTLRVGLQSWDISATWRWVGKTASHGVFYAPCILPEQYGPDHIPEGWTFICSGDGPAPQSLPDTTAIPLAIGDTLDYLCFTARDSVSVSLNRTQFFALPELWYHINQGAWHYLVVGQPIHLNQGDRLYLRAGATPNTTFNLSTSEYLYFTITDSVEVSGNVMSLMDATCQSVAIPSPYYFCRLFYDCHTLIGTPRLPATTLTSNCYREMFRYCTSIVTPPVLPADTLTPYCYAYMFSNCTALTQAPALPAMTLAADCYLNMLEFTNITVAPQLPATELASYCYASIFYYCRQLTTPPDLPATTLQTGCYQGMFNRCTSLTKAPRLHAATMAGGCCTSMFYGCKNLTQIQVDFTSWLSGSSSWVYDVAPQGRFVCPMSLPRQYDVSHIPEGWVVEPDYLTFTASGPSSFTLTQHGSYVAPLVEYRRNTDSVWTNLALNDIIPMADGEQVYFRAGGDGHNDYFCMDWNAQWMQFRMTGSIAASGNIMSLIDATCQSLTIPYESCFCRLFTNCTSLTSAPDLPATTLQVACYYTMFMGCTHLVTPPALPATTITSSCYAHMFDGCRSLSSAPALPATAAAINCYRGMFNGCTSLREPPALPATTLQSDCYRAMFSGCHNLQHAPDLPAAKLGDRCYYGMFQDCADIDHLKVGFTRWDPLSTRNWLTGTSPAGTLEAPCELPDQRGPEHIPMNWIFNCSGDSSVILTDTVYVRPAQAGDTLNYLCFTAQDTATIALNRTCYFPMPKIEYRLNQGDWYSMSFGQPIALNPGDQLYMRAGGDGVNTQFSRSSSEYLYFIMHGGLIHASGNIMSLLDASCESVTLPCSYCFNQLFMGCATLVTPPQLPATTLTTYCYQNMFCECTNLTSAPALPAMEVKSYSYAFMFYDCVALAAAPDLPATVLSGPCYYYMFTSCTSLKHAPQLPAKELSAYCYTSMFNGCTNLLTAPDTIGGTISREGCCMNMFSGCSHLTTVPQLPALTLGDQCYRQMFIYCTSLTSAPALPATTLMPD